MGSGESLPPSIQSSEALIQTWTHLDSSFQPDLMVLNEVISVMRMDALASSHPLSSKEDDIQTPFDIEQLFDSITYSKGAAVLRMLSDFITEEAFTTGLRVSPAAPPGWQRSHPHLRLPLCPQTYLKEFQHNNTIYKDLWKHLQMVTYHKYHVPTILPVAPSAVSSTRAQQRELVRVHHDCPTFTRRLSRLALSCPILWTPS